MTRTTTQCQPIPIAASRSARRRAAPHPWLLPRGRPTKLADLTDLDNLRVRQCTDGKPNGDEVICDLRHGEVHNGKPVWDWDLHHSFCWVLDSGNQAGGFWALANLHMLSDRGEATGICFDMPQHAGSGGSYPPLGAWVRGRPWDRSTTYPHNEPCFMLERA